MALFYVAHRLFAAHDRAVGAYIADRLSRSAGEGSVFLPFCDTDEENLVSECKGRRLFELDCARLRRITGMIAVLHGPSLDDGVCMEIGFAAALGVPVILLSTDFQTFAPTAAGPEFLFAEPLLEVIAAAVVRAHRLSPPLRLANNRFHAFLGQNLAPICDAAAQAATALLGAVPAKRLDDLRSCVGVPLAFIEPSPYIPDGMWADVAQVLRARGWRIRMARRFLTGVDTAQAARADWAAATRASLAVIDARGPETPPGAALITGACAAAGRPVLAAHPGRWPTLAEGREPNWRNLMIQYSVTARFNGVAEFLAAFDGLPCPAT